MKRWFRLKRLNGPLDIESLERIYLVGFTNCGACSLISSASATF